MKTDTPPILSGPVLVRLEYILVRSNISIESFAILALRSPLKAFFLLFINLFRLPSLKERLAAAVPLQVDQLPYDPEILSLIKRLPGPIYIFSSASRLYVEQIASHLKFAGGIYELGDRHASVQSIGKIFAAGEFSYIGGNFKDLPIWEMSQGGYIVRPTERLKRAAKLLPYRPFFIERGQSRTRFWMRAFGARQFHCAILSFLPVAWFGTAISSLAKGLLISFALLVAIAIGSFARHLINLEADRSHPILRQAPLAAGNVPIGRALAVFSGLVFAGFLVNSLLHNWSVLLLCLTALALSTYSFDYRNKPRISLLSVSCLELVSIFGPSSILVLPSQALFILEGLLTICVLVPRLLKLRYLLKSF